ncbi:Microphthalmia-associated transcription factor [Escovopsis weberi]|uniref:Microphthalmia-associated transcription factor n=1 Tax=Escovopsis weberi TaxID=150374 RepID=A0A0M9VVM3_ESCWE|nr:Microphthalmia-associated transcription factor [Escovopsis weberi]
MAQHAFNQFGSGPNAGHIDPNELAMTGGYSPSFANNNFNNNASASNAFSSGAAVLGDDELLDGLPSDGHLHNQPQDFSNMNMGFQSYQAHRNASLQIDASQFNGYSNTPEGDPIQSPFAPAYTAHYRPMSTNHHSLGTSLQSPLSYSGSPLTNAEMAEDPNFLNAKARSHMSHHMARKGSQSHNPMTPKTNSMHSIPIGSQDSPGFGPHVIRTGHAGHAGHEKSPSGNWLNTPSGSIPASFNSGFSSPMQQGMVPINEVMMKGGTSMPTKLGLGVNTSSTQEMKRKRRRESHNLVERRRRDNINERIQDLSRLVPSHRLEDEKIKKMISNGTPLSPTLSGISNPSQATSGLAGPGARRATGSGVGNITTGLPIEEKDKGPNKGDILNGAVSWTRDLMWILHLKLQQQEELMNTIAELGGHMPFELTDDERRMQSELMDAIAKNESGAFSYSRTSGSGLRVPHHTDYRGEVLNGLGANLDSVGITPEGSGSGGMVGDIGDTASFWHDHDDDVNGNGALHFKEEDEYDMDLTQ